MWKDKLQWKEYDSGKYIKNGGMFEVIEKPYLFPFIFTIKDIPYEFNISYRYLVIKTLNKKNYRIYNNKTL
jgi:hypothetical protein